MIFICISLYINLTICKFGYIYIFINLNLLWLFNTKITFNKNPLFLLFSPDLDTWIKQKNRIALCKYHKIYFKASNISSHILTFISPFISKFIFFRQRGHRRDWSKQNAFPKAFWLKICPHSIFIGASISYREIGQVHFSINWLPSLSDICS